LTTNFFHHAWEEKQGVCHTVALPFTFFLKKYLKAKEELWETQKIFHHAQKIIFKKSL
jgi:hypothetical protein